MGRPRWFCRSSLRELRAALPLLGCLLLVSACGDDESSSDRIMSEGGKKPGSGGDGDGDQTPPGGDGDGDGDQTPPGGDGDGDGDQTPPGGDGDGDGDQTPPGGDGDGDQTPPGGDGDGDGDQTPPGGDGDGDGDSTPPAGDGDGDGGDGDGEGDLPDEPVPYTCGAGNWDHDENEFTPCQAWTVCPAGTKQSNTPSATEDRLCAPCAAGVYCAGGATPEVACGTGDWDHDGNPATECQAWGACAPGEQEVQEPSALTNRECAPCSPGNYCPGGTAALIACGDGDWDDDANAATPCKAWTLCVPGYVSPEGGSALSDRVCAACEPGNYCPGGNNPGESCPLGTWDHDANSATLCVLWSNCAPGTYVSNTPNERVDRVCTPCGPGLDSSVENATECVAPSVTSCPPGQQLSGGSCKTCAAGRYCAGGTSAAVACGAGTWDHDLSAATPCVLWQDCAAGTYASPGTATSDRSCTPCASGTMSSSVNATSCTPWSSCAKGFVISQPGTATTHPVCAYCSSGQFCAGGDAARVTCADVNGWDHDSNPATACENWSTCPAGTRVFKQGSSTANRQCMACADGTYSSTANSTSCQAWENCAAGTRVAVQPSASQNRVCSACASGTFSSSQNQNVCLNWKVCLPPLFYTAQAGTSTTDRQCAAAAKEIAAGNQHFCAVYKDNRIGCWGTSYCNQTGVSKPQQNVQNYITSPSFVSGLPAGQGVQQLALEQDSTCALLANGEVWCWGRTPGISEYVCSTGTNYSATPQRLAFAGGAGVSLSQIASSGHAGSKSQWYCGLEQRTSGKDRIWCWGNPDSGWANAGTTAVQYVPDAQMPVNEIASIAMSMGALCFIQDDANKQLWCAPPASATSALDFQKVNVGEIASSSNPSRTWPFDTVALTSANKCGLIDAGGTQRLTCWGTGYAAPTDNPRLLTLPAGTGTLKDLVVGSGRFYTFDDTRLISWSGATAPATVQTFTSTLDGVAAANNTQCVLLTTGELQCWGNNFEGNTGTGLTGPVSSPTRVLAPQ